MNSKAVRYLLILLLSALTALAMTACTGGEAPDTEPAEETAAEEVMEGAGEAAAVELNEAALAVLAKADAMDGAEDMIVAKCPGCGLAMEGNAEHALHLGDYELHFCSADCMDKFNEGPVEALLAMQFSEAEATEAVE